jgi:hypothetical protein
MKIDPETEGFLTAQIEKARVFSDIYLTDSQFWALAEYLYQAGRASGFRDGGNHAIDAYDKALKAAPTQRSDG